MGLRIRTNVQSLVAQRHLTANQNKAASTMSKLASGHRITKAADDAAGLAISESLNADIRSLAQAQRNASDAISMLQVAEGGLQEISNIVVRLKELTIQAASDTVGVREREFLNREFMALKNEIDRIALSTDYNGTRLLVGNKEIDPSLAVSHNYSPLEFQIGKEYLLPPDSLESPNPVNIIRADFSKMDASLTGENSLNLGTPEQEDGTSIISKQQAQRSMIVIEQALEKVASYRASIGAQQNRLDATDRNLSVSIENLATAKSRIKDADFAKETSAFTQSNVLVQAGASILTQANQLPNVALQLLNQ